MPRIHCRTAQTHCLQTMKMSWCVLPISRPDTHLVHGLTQPSHSTGIALLKHRQRCDPSPVDPQIRKRCGARGVIGHDPGRGIVPTDNSAASRSYMPARSRYKCCWVSTPNPNMLGWKVCHTQKVTLGCKGALHQRELTDELGRVAALH